MPMSANLYQISKTTVLHLMYHRSINMLKK